MDEPLRRREGEEGGPDFPELAVRKKLAGMPRWHMRCCGYSISGASCRLASYVIAWPTECNDAFVNPGGYTLTTRTVEMWMRVALGAGIRPTSQHIVFNAD